MESLPHYGAGWVAGIFGTLIGHPMDTIKTHQQTAQSQLSIRKVITRIIKTNGLLGLYKGMLFPLLCSGAINSIYFGVSGTTLKIFQSLRGNEKILPSNSGWTQDLFIAGCIGGSTHALITCPTELIKIKMQLGIAIVKKGKETTYKIKKIYTYQSIMKFNRNHGIHPYFHGFIPTLWRDGLSGGLYGLCYHCLRHYMHGELNTTPGLMATLVAGGIAGAASSIAVIPFDTIKSIIQAENFVYPKYKGMYDCSKELFKHAGYRGFFKGFYMITLRSVPVNVSIMYGYQLVLDYWKFD